MINAQEIDRLNSLYAAILDEDRLDDWIQIFAETSSYRIVTRENHASNLPLALLDLQSKGMIRDRVSSLRNHTYFEPYYQCHILSPGRESAAKDGISVFETNFMVIKTKPRNPSQLFCAGRYIDQVVMEGSELRFLSKTCILDSDLILNSIALPL